MGSLMSGNIEIGNGYGVPGGGAYYGAPNPNIDTPTESKELPEYLKRKLKARGILKDDTEKGSPVSTNMVVYLSSGGRMRIPYLSNDVDLFALSIHIMISTSQLLKLEGFFAFLLELSPKCQCTTITFSVNFSPKL